MPRNGFYKITRKGDRLLSLHQEEQQDSWEAFNTSIINQVIKNADNQVNPDSEAGEDLAWFTEVTGRLGLLQHIKEDESFLDEHVSSKERHIVEELLDKGYIRFIAFKER